MLFVKIKADLESWGSVSSDIFSFFESETKIMTIILQLPLEMVNP